MARVRLGVRSAVAAIVLAVIASACIPLFSGTVLLVTDNGTIVIISWPEATDEDPGEWVEYYSVEVDGIEVARIYAPSVECQFVDLEPSTNYDFDVTAYGNTGEWSGEAGGDAAGLGRLEANHTTSGGISGTGTAIDCVDTNDDDGDRLPNAVETDTGVNNGRFDLGTDPALADTDGDYLFDGDEVLGTVDGLDLAALGTDPLKKDLLLEFDWFDDNADPGVCSAHSHRPTAAAMAEVATVFADSPVTNPDGTTGVNFIADYGQGGAFTGGNYIYDSDGVISGGVDGTPFLNRKATHFAPERWDYFHWVLLPHRYDTTSGSSGQAEIWGDDMIVSLQCYGNNHNVAHTTMHELGHNLALRHGGNENHNYKPNYNSVMNYDYQFPGVDTDCFPGGDGVLDYSYGTRATLDENELYETDGMCGGVDIDWDADLWINPDSVEWNISGDPGFQVLNDHDDWAALAFSGPFFNNDGAPLFPPEIITDQPIPPSAQILPE